MKKLLYINGNPNFKETSYSRQVGDYFVDNYIDKTKDTEVITFNVYDEYVPVIDGDVLSAWGALASGTQFNELSSEQQKKVGRMGEILALFKSVDEYVIVTPLWNFSIPPQMKAFIDSVAIAGETFKYTEHGPVGLLSGKKARVIQASGGYYSQGPMAAVEHGRSYLKDVLNFLGIEVLEPILVEGTAMPNITKEEHLATAFAVVDDLLK